MSSNQPGSNRDIARVLPQRSTETSDALGAHSRNRTLPSLPIWAPNGMWCKRFIAMGSPSVVGADSIRSAFEQQSERASLQRISLGARIERIRALEGLAGGVDQG